MSKDEIAEKIGEQGLGERADTVWGFTFALAAKYGLPSLCCAWLFYVIWCKDQQLYTQSVQVTTALVESNHARTEEAYAKKETAEAIRDLADAVKGMK